MMDWKKIYKEMEESWAGVESPLNHPMKKCGECKEEKQSLRDHILKLENTMRYINEAQEKTKELLSELYSLAESEEAKDMISGLRQAMAGEMPDM